MIQEISKDVALLIPEFKDIITNTDQLAVSDNGETMYFKFTRNKIFLVFAHEMKDPIRVVNHDIMKAYYILDSVLDLQEMLNDHINSEIKKK